VTGERAARAVPLWKRVFDVVASVVLLVALGPVLGVAALLVRITTGSPVLFRQMRLGQDARPFVLFKFRTMITQTTGASGVLSEGERLTRIGRVLRSLSIDELPSLWNVLRADMSLVGPRPLLPQYLSHYSPEQYRRHEVRPGITGWAQVNGRNSLSWEERFRYDVWYVDHLSPLLDLRILGRTVVTMVRRDGISPQGRATMESFHGSSR